MSRVRAIAATCIAVLAACQPGADTVGSGPPITAGSSAVAATLEPQPSASPDESAPTVIDATLLGFLPDSVNDVPVEEAVDEAAIALADPTVARIGSAVDVGLALDEGSGNLVTAHVVRLREGAFDDAVFRQWRDTFDDGACAAAGGVNARAELTIDDRSVFVTSCVGDLRTYHVWVEDRELLISAASVGTGRFGELLMDELRIP